MLDTIYRRWALLTAQFRSATCPYCFDRFRLAATPFRCAALPRKCAHSTDVTLEATWADSTPMGKFIESTDKFRMHADCECKTRSHARLCPTCHQELPSHFAETRNYVFSVVGARAAGKSHFVTAVVETFKHDRGPKLDIVMRPVNSQAAKRYETALRTPLYTSLHILEPTRPSDLRRDSALPFVFQAKVSRPGRLSRKKQIVAAFYLSFFDTPGEDLQSDERTSNLTRYILNSDGIVALIDPLGMASVLAKRPEAARGRAGSNDDPVDIVNRIAAAIRRHTGIGAKAQIKIPIAVTVSKLDVVDGLIDPTSPLRQNAPNVGGFPSDDADAASLDMRTKLIDWITPYIVQNIESEFATVKYFGVSALGEAPDAGGNIRSINPRRVTSPIEWLLHVNGLLDSAAQR